MDVPGTARRRSLIFLAVAGGVLWIPTAQLLLGDPPGFLDNLGFFAAPSGTPLAWVLAIAVAAAYVAYSLRNPIVARYWLEPSLLKLFALLVAIAAAIVEEAFFRRMLMDGVMQAGGGPLVQTAASAVVFGVAHGLWGIVTGRWIVAVSVVLITGALGAALAIVYLVGERSLAPVIVSHFLITGSIQPGITFAAFSGTMRLPTARRR